MFFGTAVTRRAIYGSAQAVRTQGTDRYHELYIVAAARDRVQFLVRYLALGVLLRL